MPGCIEPSSLRGRAIPTWRGVGPSTRAPNGAGASFAGGYVSFLLSTHLFRLFAHNSASSLVCRICVNITSLQACAWARGPREARPNWDPARRSHLPTHHPSPPFLHPATQRAIKMLTFPSGLTPRRLIPYIYSLLQPPTFLSFFFLPVPTSPLKMLLPYATILLILLTATDAPPPPPPRLLDRRLSRTTPVASPPTTLLDTPCGRPPSLRPRISLSQPPRTPSLPSRLHRTPRYRAPRAGRSRGAAV